MFCPSLDRRLALRHSSDKKPRPFRACHPTACFSQALIRSRGDFDASS
jgi:hypothetical protein